MSRTTDQDLSTNVGRYLVFSLKNEKYGVPLHSVREVIATPEARSTPNQPTYFRGIMNLRGEVISMIDLGQKLGLPKAEAGSESAVIILDFASQSIGVVVDSVESVLAVEMHELQPPPIMDAKSSTAITAVAKKDKELILLLDAAKTLNLNSSNQAA